MSAPVCDICGEEVVFTNCDAELRNGGEAAARALAELAVAVHKRIAHPAVVTVMHDDGTMTVTCMGCGAEDTRRPAGPTDSSTAARLWWESHRCPGPHYVGPVTQAPLWAD